MQTDVHGEFFIAEMIAGQSETKKALVAQVKDKAVGLMVVTKDVDIHMLHQCFKLESYDNLLKSDYMDAVRKRREAIRLEKLKVQEENRKEQLRRLKEETIVIRSHCNLIEMQHNLTKSGIAGILQRQRGNSTEANRRSNEQCRDQQTVKRRSRTAIGRNLSWIHSQATIRLLRDQSNRRHRTYYLACYIIVVCNIQAEKEFLISTLHLFGLPEKYMEGEGHFADLGKKSEEEKAKAKKRSIAKKIKEKKESQRKKQHADRKGGRKADGLERPTHFDLKPFFNAFKLFLTATGDARSLLRKELRKKPRSVLETIFVDEDGVFTFKKCVDLMTFGKKLVEKGFEIPPQIADVVGYMLICFGEIAYYKHSVLKMAEELKTEEDKEIDPVLAKITKRQQAKKEQEAKEEPPKPVQVTLFDTSIHDFLQAVEKMQDYDYTLYNLGILKAELDSEINQKEEKVHVEEEAKEEVKVEVKKESAEKDEEDDIFGSESEGDQDRKEDLSPVGGEERQKGEMVRDVKRQETKARVKTPEMELLYSKDIEYENIVKTLNDLETIPEAPEKAKNAFAITIFILEAAFESRGCDFLQFAFDLFPDKDYMIITQPHNVPESSLLKSFTLIDKKPESTFSHVLYVLHRDSLLGNQLKVRLAEPGDYGKTREFLQPLVNSEEATESIYEVMVNKDPTKQCFLTTLHDDIMGVLVLSKDVNLPYYQSHFHIQDYMLLREHERSGHKRVLTFVMNPIFEKYSRFVLREALRLTAASSFYMELHENTAIPTLMSQLIHVKSRRFPHFLARKWNHERFDPKEVLEFSKEHDGGSRDPVDETESKFSLFLTTKRLLSEPKIVNNSRIVVIGASDTGLSFIETLLSLKYIHFTNIVLLAPGGFSYTNPIDPFTNFKACSTSYTPEEIQNLMLESRIRVLNSRMIDIDRQQKSIILYDDSVLPYDILVLTMGLQEKTLQSLGYVSRGIAPIPTDYIHLDGVISVDDPYLYQHLRPGGTIISMLAHKKKPERCVVYGRSLSTLCCIQGLIKRGVKPHMITLAIPDLFSHMRSGYDTEEEVMTEEFSLNPKACYDKDVEALLLNKLEAMGVQILKEVALKKIVEDDRNQLSMVVFEKLGYIPEEDKSQKEEGDLGSGSSRSGIEGEEKKLQEGEEEEINLREVKVACRVLITAGHKDVDIDVFNALHNNSLVYNGRLIVDSNFQTNDPAIFAGGSLCAFSGKYQAFAAGKPLNMHHYNGREIGLRMTTHLLDIHYPAIASMEQSSLAEDMVLSFNLPIGYGGVVYPNLYYYYIRSPLTVPSESQPSLVCNNLTAEFKGTYIKFTFNELGIIDSVLYMGSEKVVLQSLWSLVGLHESYLNKLRPRHDKKIIPNVAEFLSENWAIALYHDWFADFTLRLKKDIQNTEELQTLLGKVSEQVLSGKKFGKTDVEEIVSKVEPKTVKYIEDATVEYLRANQNHLPMYYVPGTEFEQQRSSNYYPLTNNNKQHLLLIIVII
eukprot:TRINITY_DN1355_c0_g1_i1.p1 TRINITY_DN1355_c0_g1~~TRINITY_DN1355_c0_g1_i1.p1  ORF type:complete len:1491 (-),score=241.80 TRINITY_DN1355_c0_g1_i1:5780-10252(-)